MLLREFCNTLISGRSVQIERGVPPESSDYRRFHPMEMSSGVVAAHSPPFSRRGARGIKSLEAEGGVVSKRSRSLLTCSRSAPYFLLKLLTVPSAPLRNRIFLLRRSHPSLKRRGMGPQPHLNSSPSAETYKVVAGFRPYASFSLESAACKEVSTPTFLRPEIWG